MGLNPTTPATIPAGFQDKLATEMALAPDSEFILGQWLRSGALAAQMANEDGFDLAMEQIKAGRLGAMGAAGNIEQAMSGGMGGPLLLSEGMLFPDFVSMVREAKNPGEVIKVPRPRFVDGGTTESSRKLGPTQKMFGTNSQGPGIDQVDVSIFEYGGPGDANSALSPLALSRFAQHRSEHDLLKYIGYQLRRDRWKFVDDLAYTRLIAAAPRTRPASRAAATSHRMPRSPASTTSRSRSRSASAGPRRFAPARSQACRASHEGSTCCSSTITRRRS
jgi:hypothetical protein